MWNLPRIEGARRARGARQPFEEEPYIMPKDIFPQTTPALAATRKKLAPGIHEAFTSFSERVFADGALPVKTKQLIAIDELHGV